MAVEQGANFTIKFVDARTQCVELLDEGFDVQTAGFEDGGIVGKSNGFGDDAQAFIDHVGASGLPEVVELSQGLWPGFLDSLKGGPLGQKIAGDFAVEIFPGDLEGLRIVVFEH